MSSAAKLAASAVSQKSQSSGRPTTEEGIGQESPFSTSRVPTKGNVPSVSSRFTSSTISVSRVSSQSAIKPSLQKVASTSSKTSSGVRGSVPSSSSVSTRAPSAVRGSPPKSSTIQGLSTSSAGKSSSVDSTLIAHAASQSTYLETTTATSSQSTANVFPGSKDAPVPRISSTSDPPLLSSSSSSDTQRSEIKTGPTSSSITTRTASSSESSLSSEGLSAASTAISTLVSLGLFLPSSAPSLPGLLISEGTNIAETPTGSTTIAYTAVTADAANRSRITSSSSISASSGSSSFSSNVGSTRTTSEFVQTVSTGLPIIESTRSASISIIVPEVQPTASLTSKSGSISIELPTSSGELIASSFLTAVESASHTIDIVSSISDTFTSIPSTLAQTTIDGISTESILSGFNQPTLSIELSVSSIASTNIADPLPTMAQSAEPSLVLSESSTLLNSIDASATSGSSLSSANFPGPLLLPTAIVQSPAADGSTSDVQTYAGSVPTPDVPSSTYAYNVNPVSTIATQNIGQPSSLVSSDSRTQPDQMPAQQTSVDSTSQLLEATSSMDSAALPITTSSSYAQEATSADGSASPSNQPDTGESVTSSPSNSETSSTIMTSSEATISQSPEQAASTSDAILTPTTSSLDTQSTPLKADTSSGSELDQSQATSTSVADVNSNSGSSTTGEDTLVAATVSPVLQGSISATLGLSLGDLLPSDSIPSTVTEIEATIASSEPTSLILQSDLAGVETISDAATYSIVSPSLAALNPTSIDPVFVSASTDGVVVVVPTSVTAPDFAVPTSGSLVVLSGGEAIAMSTPIPVVSLSDPLPDSEASTSQESLTSGVPIVGPVLNLLSSETSSVILPSETSIDAVQTSSVDGSAESFVIPDMLPTTATDIVLPSTTEIPSYNSQPTPDVGSISSEIEASTTLELSDLPSQASYAGAAVSSSYDISAGAIPTSATEIDSPSTDLPFDPETVASDTGIDLPVAETQAALPTTSLGSLDSLLSSIVYDAQTVDVAQPSQTAVESFIASGDDQASASLSAEISVVATGSTSPDITTTVPDLYTDGSETSVKIPTSINVNQQVPEITTSADELTTVLPGSSVDNLPASLTSLEPQDLPTSTYMGDASATSSIAEDLTKALPDSSVDNLLASLTSLESQDSPTSALVDDISGIVSSVANSDLPAVTSSTVDGIPNVPAAASSILSEALPSDLSQPSELVSSIIDGVTTDIPLATDLPAAASSVVDGFVPTSASDAEIAASSVVDNTVDLASSIVSSVDPIATQIVSAVTDTGAAATSVIDSVGDAASYIVSSSIATLDAAESETTLVPISTDLSTPSLISGVPDPSGDLPQQTNEIGSVPQYSVDPSDPATSEILSSIASDVSMATSDLAPSATSELSLMLSSEAITSTDLLSVVESTAQVTNLDVSATVPVVAEPTYSQVGSITTGLDAAAPSTALDSDISTDMFGVESTASASVPSASDLVSLGDDTTTDLPISPSSTTLEATNVVNPSVTAELSSSIESSVPQRDTVSDTLFPVPSMVETLLTSAVDIVPSSTDLGNEASITESGVIPTANAIISSQTPETLTTIAGGDSPVSSLIDEPATTTDASDLFSTPVVSVVLDESTSTDFASITPISSDLASTSTILEVPSSELGSISSTLDEVVSSTTSVDLGLTAIQSFTDLPTRTTNISPSDLVSADIPTDPSQVEESIPNSTTMDITSIPVMPNESFPTVAPESSEPILTAIGVTSTLSGATATLAGDSSFYTDLSSSTQLSPTEIIYPTTSVSADLDISPDPEGATSTSEIPSLSVTDSVESMPTSDADLDQLPTTSLSDILSGLPTEIETVGLSTTAALTDLSITPTESMLSTSAILSDLGSSLTEAIDSMTSTLDASVTITTASSDMLVSTFALGAAQSETLVPLPAEASDDPSQPIKSTSIGSIETDVVAPSVVTSGDIISAITTEPPSLSNSAIDDLLSSSTDFAEVTSSLDAASPSTSIESFNYESDIPSSDVAEVQSTTMPLVGSDITSPSAFPTDALSSLVEIATSQIEAISSALDYDSITASSKILASATDTALVDSSSIETLASDIVDGSTILASESQSLPTSTLDSGVPVSGLPTDIVTFTDPTDAVSPLLSSSIINDESSVSTSILTQPTDISDVPISTDGQSEASAPITMDINATSDSIKVLPPVTDAPTITTSEPLASITPAPEDPETSYLDTASNVLDAYSTTASLADSSSVGPESLPTSEIVDATGSLSITSTMQDVSSAIMSMNSSSVDLESLPTSDVADAAELPSITTSSDAWSDIPVSASTNIEATLNTALTPLSINDIPSSTTSGSLGLITPAPDLPETSFLDTSSLVDHTSSAMPSLVGSSGIESESQPTGAITEAPSFPSSITSFNALSEVAAALTTSTEEIQEPTTMPSSTVDLSSITSSNPLPLAAATSEAGEISSLETASAILNSSSLAQATIGSLTINPESVLTSAFVETTDLSFGSSTVDSESYLPTSILTQTTNTPLIMSDPDIQSGTLSSTDVTSDYITDVSMVSSATSVLSSVVSEITPLTTGLPSSTFSDLSALTTVASEPLETGADLVDTDGSTQDVSSMISIMSSSVIVVSDSVPTSAISEASDVPSITLGSQAETPTLPVTPSEGITGISAFSSATDVPPSMVSASVADSVSSFIDTPSVSTVLGAVNASSSLIGSDMTTPTSILAQATGLSDIFTSLPSTLSQSLDPDPTQILSSLMSGVDDTTSTSAIVQISADPGLSTSINVPTLSSITDAVETPTSAGGISSAVTLSSVNIPTETPVAVANMTSLGSASEIESAVASSATPTSQTLLDTTLASIGSTLAASAVQSLTSSSIMDLPTTSLPSSFTASSESVIAMVPSLSVDTVLPAQTSSDADLSNAPGTSSTAIQISDNASQTTFSASLVAPTSYVIQISSATSSQGDDLISSILQVVSSDAQSASSITLSSNPLSTYDNALGASSSTMATRSAQTAISSSLSDISVVQTVANSVASTSGLTSAIPVISPSTSVSNSVLASQLSLSASVAASSVSPDLGLSSSVSYESSSGILPTPVTSQSSSSEALFISSSPSVAISSLLTSSLQTATADLVSATSILQSVSSSSILSSAMNIDVGSTSIGILPGVETTSTPSSSTSLQSSPVAVSAISSDLLLPAASSGTSIIVKYLAILERIVVLEHCAVLNFTANVDQLTIVKPLIIIKRLAIVKHIKYFGQSAVVEYCVQHRTGFVYYCCIVFIEQQLFDYQLSCIESATAPTPSSSTSVSTLISTSQVIEASVSAPGFVASSVSSSINIGASVFSSAASSTGTTQSLVSQSSFSSLSSVGSLSSVSSLSLALSIAVPTSSTSISQIISGQADGALSSTSSSIILSASSSSTTISSSSSTVSVVSSSTTTGYLVDVGVGSTSVGVIQTAGGGNLVDVAAGSVASTQISASAANPITTAVGSVIGSSGIGTTVILSTPTTVSSLSASATISGSSASSSSQSVSSAMTAVSLSTSGSILSSSIISIFSPIASTQLGGIGNSLLVTSQTSSTLTSVVSAVLDPIIKYGSRRGQHFKFCYKCTFHTSGVVRCIWLSKRINSSDAGKQPVNSDRFIDVKQYAIEHSDCDQ
ncbi:hypothetical protein KCU99_g462, partial [Aureobasidium melanogenum]